MSVPRIVVGVSGGIAAYKSSQLVSWLAQQAVEVQCVLTEAGGHFIGAATLAALTGRPVAQQVFASQQYPLGAHIELARATRLLVVAPASADFLAKAAHGLADDLLSTLYLCYRGSVLMAPAMNSAMWDHPATQRNVNQLREDGVEMIGPETGWLSCREEGAGRMAEPLVIGQRVLELLGQQPRA